MSDKFSIHWLQDIVNKIKERNEKIITLSTGKTPSGHIHIGILREIIICDSLRRIFEKEGYKVNNYLFFDSMDAAKRFPGYIDKDFQNQHLGKPFFLIPCPYNDCGCESYAYHFGQELYMTFDDFGIKNEIIWSHNLYKTSEMQERIKIALEHTDEIKEILKKYILPTLDDEKKKNFLEMQKTWMPVMVICEECNRLLYVKEDGSIEPNRVINYNSKTQKVFYECNACGFKNELSILSNKLKLNWRIDWPAKWSIFKTTCEPAGKDHSVKGGAYDTGLELCKKLYNYKGPVKVPYEWLRLGDYDMKTSKGIVFTPKMYLKMADPEIFRMLILRTNPMKHISLRIEEFPQYYDFFNKIEEVYYGINNTVQKEEIEFFKYIYPLIKLGEIPKERKEKFPLKLLIFLAQLQKILNPEKIYKKAREILEKQNFNNIPTFEEFKLLLDQTTTWLEEIKKILNEEKDQKAKRILIQKLGLFEIPEKVDITLINTLSEKQIQGILLFRDFLLNNNDLDEDIIQNQIFNIAKEKLNIPPKKLFEAFYKIILGKKYGPRLGPFLILLDKNWLLERLNIKTFRS
ncbi:MAG: lysine--tRNA ligase [Promethearchaeota archaeon]